MAEIIEDHQFLSTSLSLITKDLSGILDMKEFRYYTKKELD